MNQPDFEAEETFFEYEPSRNGGFSSVSKIAKKGNFYRSDFDGSITFIKIDQPQKRYYGSTNTLSEALSLSNNSWHQDINYVAIFASQSNKEFSDAGDEIVLGHNCKKIEFKTAGEASGKNSESAIFYVAKDLKNLVIAIKITLSDRTRQYTLRNISLNVPDNLFSPIENYKSTLAR